MCSAQASAVRMWRLRRASSLAVSISRHVMCGLYLPGGIGMKSRMGRPKTHIAGDSFVRVQRITVLEYRPLHSVGVEFALRACIVIDEPLHRLHPDLCAAVAVGEGHRCEAVEYAPSAKERPGLGGGELWPPVRCKLLRSPVRAKARRRWHMRSAAPPVDLEMIGQFE